MESNTELTVERQCELLELNVSSYYYKPAEKPPEAVTRDEQLRVSIDELHTDMPYLGARRLAVKINEGELRTNRKEIRRFMVEMGIYAVYPKPNLSKANKKHTKYPYLLRNKLIFLPNQVWAVDITYIRLRYGHMYLTAVIDWHSRFIVGWGLSDTLDTAPVLQTVKQAIGQHGIPAILNSDQGVQFTSDEYTSYLKEQGIRQSMDGKARWVDNVIIERWFRSLKYEDIYINEYNSPRELRVGIGAYVRKYNRDRPHQSLDYATPAYVYHLAWNRDEEHKVC